MEWRGLLVPGAGIRAATFPGFRRLLTHRDRRRASPGLHHAGKLRASVSIDQSFDLLDALAHVAVVLDSRLRFPPAGHIAPRGVVAKFRARDLDGVVRTLASSQRAVSGVGLLSRRAPCASSSSAAGPAQIRLGTCRDVLDSVLVDCDHGAYQP